MLSLLALPNRYTRAPVCRHVHYSGVDTSAAKFVVDLEFNAGSLPLDHCQTTVYAPSYAQTVLMSMQFMDPRGMFTGYVMTYRQTNHAYDPAHVVLSAHQIRPQQPQVRSKGSTHQDAPAHPGRECYRWPGCVGLSRAFRTSCNRPRLSKPPAPRLPTAALPAAAATVSYLTELTKANIRIPGGTEEQTQQSDVAKNTTFSLHLTKLRFPHVTQAGWVTMPKKQYKRRQNFLLMIVPC